MADELNVPTHRWYEPRNNIALPPNAVSAKYIYASGIALIDAWINSQPWGFLSALNEETPPAVFAILPGNLVVASQTVPEWTADQLSLETYPPVFAVLPYHDAVTSQTVGDWIASQLNAEDQPPVYAIAPYDGVTIF